jgi:aryl-alcohol dehydrogenase-like predicted oxidoreductase
MLAPHIALADERSQKYTGFPSSAKNGGRAMTSQSIDELAIAVLGTAVAHGVDHIDTSDFYGPHVTNQLIAEALWPYPTGLTIVTNRRAKHWARTWRWAAATWRSYSRPT